MNWQQTKVLVVGAGGLGSPWLEALKELRPLLLGVMDGDLVEQSNLNRQFIHHDRVGEKKAKSAQTYLEQAGFEGEIKIYPYYAESSNFRTVAEDYDLILDGTDQFKAKYLISTTAQALSKKYLFASATDQYGQVSYFDFKNNGACLRCLYPEHEKVHALAVCAPVTNPEPLKVVAMKGFELIEKNDFTSLWHYEAQVKIWSGFKKTMNPECSCKNSVPDLFQDYSWSGTGEHILIPLTGDTLQDWDEDHSNTPLVISCKTGIRARAMCFFLRGRGRTNVFWTREGLEKIKINET